jgi:hypothetical protein
VTRGEVGADAGRGAFRDRMVDGRHISYSWQRLRADCRGISAGRPNLRRDGTEYTS